MASLDGQDGDQVRPMNPPSEHEKQITLQETGEGRSANEISSLAEKQDMTVADAVQFEKEESNEEKKSSDIETYDLVDDSNEVVVEEQHTSPSGVSNNSIEEEQDVREILHQSKQTKEPAAGIGWYVSVCVFILIVAFLSYKIITLESSPAMPGQTMSVQAVPTQPIQKSTQSTAVVAPSQESMQNQSNQLTQKNISAQSSIAKSPSQDQTPDADVAVGDLADRLGE